MNRRLWYLMTNSLIAVWLVLVGVAVAIHRFLPASDWLMVHLLLLGALSTAILIWSQHFADTVLRRPARGGRLSMGVRLTVHTIGAGTVMAGIIRPWWPAVLLGGILIAANAIFHAISLVGQMRGALPARFAPLVRYYIIAAAALVVGVTLGVVMARSGIAGDTHDRLFVAHIGFNLLGWVGLTVVGTVVLLWPTVLHTRVREGTDRVARRALPLLAVGLLLLGAACLFDLRVVVALAISIYLVGLGQVMIELVHHARQSPPITYAGWSIGAALAWFIVCVLMFGIVVVAAPSWGQAGDRLGSLIPVFVVGFAAQILLGALSYLLPVVLGGGPEAARVSARELDRASTFRVLVVNGGILLYLLPMPSLAKVALAGIVVAVLAAFLVLAGRAIVLGRRTRLRLGAQDGAPPAPASRRQSGMVVAATGALVMALVVGVALDPSAAGISTVSSSTAPTIGQVTPTGHTTVVVMEMVNMRFSPDTVTVPAGDRLVIKLSNKDDQVHDLVLATGVTSGYLAPGASATVDAGIMQATVDGWCSIAGHRQLGMVMKVVVTGSTASSRDTGHAHATATGPSAADDLNMSANPAAAFVARDPVLPPAPTGTVHRVTLTVKNVKTEVAPGVTQELWTYNGTAPGPTLRGRVGDVFVVTLVNDGSIGHSIDFHAGSLAPDRPMRTIQPGESSTYRFTATRSGIWLYHCSTMPMSVHIANGMFGAVIIDPPGLTPVAKEFLVVQSEYYLGPQGGEVDATKVRAQTPDLVVFNGYADQYHARPLTATVGERVRIWVLDAGPNVDSAFHVVGAQFDTVFKEGDYRLRNGGSTGTGGSQVLGLMPAQGGFVELTFPEPGSYPFVSHIMSDAEKGASGLIDVTG